MDGQPTWTDCDEAGDYVVPNMLSPRDLVSRPNIMDETVPHTFHRIPLSAGVSGLVKKKPRLYCKTGANFMLLLHCSPSMHPASVWRKGNNLEVLKQTVAAEFNSPTSVVVM